MNYNWKVLYHQYAKLFHRYINATDKPQSIRFGFLAALKPHISNDWLEYFKWVNELELSISFKQDWEEFKKFQEIYDILGKRGHSLEHPAESVYELALLLRIKGVDSTYDYEDLKKNRYLLSVNGV